MKRKKPKPTPEQSNGHYVHPKARHKKRKTACPSLEFLDGLVVDFLETSTEALPRFIAMGRQTYTAFCESQLAKVRMAEGEVSTEIKHVVLTHAPWYMEVLVLEINELVVAVAA